MALIFHFGDPTGIELTPRQFLALSAFPVLMLYTGYHLGWLNGYEKGRQKGRELYGPNK